MSMSYRVEFTLCVVWVWINLELIFFFFSGFVSFPRQSRGGRWTNFLLILSTRITLAVVGTSFRWSIVTASQKEMDQLAGQEGLSQVFLYCEFLLGPTLLKEGERRYTHIVLCYLKEWIWYLLFALEKCKNEQFYWHKRRQTGVSM